MTQHLLLNGPIDDTANNCLSADNASIVLNGVYKLEGYFGDMISWFEVYNSNFELVYKSSELSSELGASGLMDITEYITNDCYVKIYSAD